MRLTLRDLFWLVLLIACLTAGGIEHVKSARQVAELWDKSLFRIRERSSKPSDEAVKRRVALQRFAKLNDAELQEHLCYLSTCGGFSEYDQCLTEMARRGLTEALRAEYDELMAREPNELEWPYSRPNLRLLTALRRSQGARDPLTIHLTLEDGASIPAVRSTIENVDVGREPFNFRDGGDDRGGRHAKWRFVLTDSNGCRVADSNFYDMLGGGLVNNKSLEFGRSGNRVFRFDLRTYVAAPASGKYQLQALYHNSQYIADELDLSGLIVSKSEPIDVIVKNPSYPSRTWLHDAMQPLLAALATGALLAVFSVFRVARPKSVVEESGNPKNSSWSSVARRDLCWCILIFAVAIAWWFDQRHQSARILDLQPDSEAEWTITLPTAKDA